MRVDWGSVRWVREAWSAFWTDDTTRALLFGAVLMVWTIGTFLTGLTMGACLERTAIERMAVEVLR